MRQRRSAVTATTVDLSRLAATAAVAPSGSNRFRFLCLLTMTCVMSLAPPSAHATTQSDKILGGSFRHPPMLHTPRYSFGVSSPGVFRRGLASDEHVIWPPTSSVDDAAAEGPGYDAEGSDMTDEEVSAQSEPTAVLPRPDERRSRRPLLPHLLGPSSSGGVRKLVSTDGKEEEKRWAPTEIRMNEFIHKIQAVNAASRYNRRFYDPASNDYEWWARRVRRQRQQQADGTKAAQALKLYGLRTRVGLE